MYYIIQNNLFREEGHKKLIDFMVRFDMDFETVNIQHDKEEIDFFTKRNDVFCFGALKMARISKKYNWNPGCLITENHDYEVYSKYYKENLLNYDSKIIKVSDTTKWTERELFIRPCLDTKIFTGKVFTENEWKVAQNTLLTHEGYKKTVTPYTLIQVAKPKNITQEVRNWVVDGKVITSSTYRRGTFLMYDSIVDQDAIDFAQKMVDKFQIAKTFTIDVCLSNDEWKIVECGSTACAGFYDADIQKLIMALEDAF
jgi:hypothetical protein